MSAQKIKDICKQLNISEEGATQLIATLEEYKTGVDKEAEKKFTERLEKAKQVCVEEVENEKQRLQRKVEIFLESRVNTINREAQKNAAIGESASFKTLRGVKALVEGVKLEGIPEDYQALKETEKKLRVTVHKLTEAKNLAEEKANKVCKLAEKALKYTKVLESKLPQKTVAESKSTPAPAGKQPVLESLRKNGDEPKTSREVPKTSQVPAQKKAPINESNSAVNAIAEKIDETLPAYI